MAESRTGLTAELIEGYAELPETEEGNTEALYARCRGDGAVFAFSSPM